jgi:CRP-like cAMP-binding protein
MTTRLMTLPRKLDAPSDDQRDKLMTLARPVDFPADTTIFEERGAANRFWPLRDGEVQLELRVPGTRAAVVEKLGGGSLLGWPWLFPPRRWHMAAKTLTAVSTLKFDAVDARRLCEEDAPLGYVFVLACAEVIGHRLDNARTRLLDLYGPYGSGLPH